MFLLELFLADCRRRRGRFWGGEAVFDEDPAGGNHGLGLLLDVEIGLGLLFLPRGVGDRLIDLFPDLLGMGRVSEGEKGQGYYGQIEGFHCAQVSPMTEGRAGGLSAGHLA